MKKESIFDVFEKIHKDDPKSGVERIRGEVTPTDVIPEQEQEQEQEPEQEPEQEGGAADGV